MTKLELNEKLAELYSFEAMYYFKYPVLLIDDSARIFNFMVAHKICLDYGEVYIDGVKNECFYAGKKGYFINNDVFLKDHESPQAAACYAIAMALVKLAESK